MRLRPFKKSVGVPRILKENNCLKTHSFWMMTHIFFSHNLFNKSVLAIGTLYGFVFGLTPHIKIISFGVRRLKNRRVTPNREEILFKGTWQWDGFSGIFAEIGSSWVPYTTFRAVPILASNSRRCSCSKNDSPYHRYGESPTPRISDTGSRQLPVSLIRKISQGCNVLSK